MPTVLATDELLLDDSGDALLLDDSGDVLLLGDLTGYFPHRYFPNAYFPGRYFPHGAEEVVTVTPGPGCLHVHDWPLWTMDLSDAPAASFDLKDWPLHTFGSNDRAC
jgi:hypothetical protein